MGSYSEYALAVWREWIAYTAQVSKKHIGKEIIGAVAAAVAAHSLGKQAPVDAALYGLATLGLLFALTVVAGGFLAPFLVWQKQRVAIAAQKVRLRAVSDAKRPTQEALDRLARFLSDGIHDILNKSIQNDGDVLELQQVERDWTERLFAHLNAEFPPSDAILVQRLGTIVPRRFPGYEHEMRDRVLSQFSRREELIRSVLQRGARD